MYTFPDEARKALESLRQPLAIYQTIDGQVTTLLVSDGFCELLGYAERDAAVYDMDHDMYKDTHPDDRERIINAARRFMTGHQGDYDVVFRTKAGVESDYQVVHAHGKHVYMEDGTRLAHVWYMDEGKYIEGDESAATGVNRAMNSALHEESILRRDRYDALTGLPNLTYFFKRGDTVKQQILDEGNHVALLYMDLNGMKNFNHQHGFAEGDVLLKAFSELISGIFGHDNCCHIAADRFVASSPEDSVEKKLRSLFDAMRQLPRSLPVRVGIYSTAMEDVPIATAYDRAKVACDTIPASTTSGFRYYSTEMRDVIRNRHYIQNNLDRALSEKWVQVYFQPIVRAVNGRVCDEEALARWIDPEKGFLSPAEFIPYLESSGLIYKLDLYMLEQVLEKIQKQQAAGLALVPQSINLSRSDFSACDIVEEIRKRVDEAGVPHSLITIEITESVVGKDFDFMKEQVGRFRSLGFPVWMDDFGSGYSSLDVLQSIQFDLIKFDMGFMRKLDEGEQGKIILTELVKMAASLGVDTVCEGVETEEQARFLQEIGCSKLQGYYYCKPISYQEILERYRTGKQIGFEEPKTSAYYGAIGRINLYDLDVIASQEENPYQDSFKTMPIGIIEIRGDTARFVRSNPSYRAFIRRFYGIDMTMMRKDFVRFETPFMSNAVKNCTEQGSRTIFDEKMPDGSIVHSFARRIGTNPVTGEIAIAVAVLSISAPTEGETYADIARALAADYYNIYVVDLDTEKFIEYTSPVGQDELAEERHGTDFFASAIRDTKTRIYEEDREPFLAWFTKKNVIRALDEQGVFTTTYRLIDTGKPMYVSMKITRMQGTNRIIIGVSIIDAQMKQRERKIGT